MKWTPGGQSEDVEDRRGEGGGGGGGGMRLGIGGVLVLGVLSLVFKRNLFSDYARVTNQSPVGQSPAAAPRTSSPEDEKLVQFVSFVLDDVQKTWAEDFKKRGKVYPHAKLVLFTDEVRTACGGAESASGPFYCPGDHKAYIDLSFYREMKERFQAPGDFAQAYVIAHELGHHVQNVLGIESKMRSLQSAHPGQANAYSVKLELQADCFAGIWGHSTEQRNILEQGDVEEALNCAAAIGDDRLQKQARGRVTPDTFTHGSSEQRVRWFKRGMQSGKIEDCDTFSADTL
jgi:predicted metalloprotease